MRLSWRIVSLFCFFLAVPCLGRAQEVRVSKVNCEHFYNPSHLVNLSHAISIIQQVGFPKEWLVLIACNDEDWEHIKQGTKLSPYHAKTAFTSLKKRTTVVKLAIFDAVYNMGNPPWNVLLHEVGHIRCQCSDEDEADKLGHTHRPAEH